MGEMDTNGGIRQLNERMTTLLPSFVVTRYIEKWGQWRLEERSIEVEENLSMTEDLEIYDRNSNVPSEETIQSDRIASDYWNDRYSFPYSQLLLRIMYNNSRSIDIYIYIMSSIDYVYVWSFVSKVTKETESQCRSLSEGDTGVATSSIPASTHPIRNCAYILESGAAWDRHGEGWLRPFRINKFSLRQRKSAFIPVAKSTHKSTGILEIEAGAVNVVEPKCDQIVMATVIQGSWV